MKRLLFGLAVFAACAFLFQPNGWCPLPPSLPGLTGNGTESPSFKAVNIGGTNPYSFYNFGTQTSSFSMSSLYAEQEITLTNGTACTITLPATPLQNFTYVLLAQIPPTGAGSPGGLTMPGSNFTWTGSTPPWTSYPGSQQVAVYLQTNDGTNWTASYSPKIERMATYADSSAATSNSFCMVAPYSGTITNWAMTSGGASGSATITPAYSTQANWYSNGTTTSMVGTGTAPAIGSGYGANGAVSNWSGTLVVNAGDELCFTESGVSTITKLNLVLWGVRK